jgi:hypothetical protein
MSCGQQSKSPLNFETPRGVNKESSNHSNNSPLNTTQTSQEIQSKIDELITTYKCEFSNISCSTSNLGYYEIESLVELLNTVYEEIITPKEDRKYSFAEISWSDKKTALLIKAMMDSKKSLQKKLQEKRENFTTKKSNIIKLLKERTELKRIEDISYVQAGFSSEYAALDTASRWIDGIEEQIEFIEKISLFKSFNDIRLINITNLAILTDRYEDRIAIYHHFDIESNLELIHLKTNVRSKLKTQLDGRYGINSIISFSWSIDNSKDVVNYEEYKNNILKIQTSTFLDQINKAIKDNNSIRKFKFDLSDKGQQSETVQIADGSLFLNISY